MRIVRKLLLALAAAGLFVIVTGASGAKADSMNYEFGLEITDNSGFKYVVDGPFATSLFDNDTQKYATSGEGWSYDDASRTLTLDGFEGSNILCMPYGGDGAINVIVKGYNKVIKKVDQDYNSAILFGTYAGGKITTTIGGDGVLYGELTKVGARAVGGDYIILKDSVTLICKDSSGSGDYCAYNAQKTVIGENARLEAYGSGYQIYASGGEGYMNESAKDEINGILICEVDDGAPYKAYLYTAATAKLGKDRVVYNGTSRKTMVKSKIADGYYGGYADISDDKDAKVVVICGKNDDLKDIIGYSAVSGNSKSTAVAIKKVSSTKKGQAKVTWKKVSGAKGYEIFTSDSENGEFKKAATVKKNAAKGTVKKLKSGSTVYFKVRSYTEKDGKKEYGEFSEVKKAKIK